MGAVGIITTLYTSVVERIREIGTLKAIGAKNITILGLFLFEALLIGVMGASLGLVAGIGMGYLLASASPGGGGGGENADVGNSTGAVQVLESQGQLVQTKPKSRHKKQNSYSCVSWGRYDESVVYFSWVECDGWLLTLHGRRHAICRWMR